MLIIVILCTTMFKAFHWRYRERKNCNKRYCLSTTVPSCNANNWDRLFLQSLLSALSTKMLIEQYVISKYSLQSTALLLSLIFCRKKITQLAPSQWRNYTVVCFHIWCHNRMLFTQLPAASMLKAEPSNVGTEFLDCQQPDYDFAN